MAVDVLTVLAPGESLWPEALAALDRQGFVEFRHFFTEGRRRPGERRVETIARARNAAKEHGNAPYVLFLDRDVVLPERGIERLAFALALHPDYGALGIDYQGESPSPAPHVAMGAVLFRRSVLQQVRFRTEPSRCECWCCCVDVRRLGYRIDYLPNLRAEHRKTGDPAPVRGSAGSMADGAGGDASGGGT